MSNKIIAGLIVVVIIIVGVFLYLQPRVPRYTDSALGFSIQVPSDYTTDTSYVYQLAPEREIKGVKFTIPAALTTGTNLSKDSYLSVESLSNAASCSAALFLDGDHSPTEVTDAGQKYSYVTAGGAGAGNRYEETVYALPGTNPCLAVRYFIHYTVVQNYPEGTMTEFDKAALMKRFDEIRRTLIVQ